MASANIGHEHQVALGFAAESSAVEAIGGAAAVVLGILGLAQVSPMYLAPIATIVVGVALWFEGAAIVARYSRLVSAEARSGAVVEMPPASSGMSAELLGGAAGTVLGILALVGFAPEILILSALLTVGAALALSGAAFTTTRRMQQRVQG